MEMELDKNAGLPTPEADTVDRIRYLLRNSRRTQSAFAELLGFDPANFSRVLSRKLRVSDGLLNKMVVNLGVSKEWLATGYGVPFPKTASHWDDNGRQAHAGAPVYDIDVTAGCIPLARMLTDERVIGWVNLPNVDPRNAVVRVTGDSMSPRIPNGSFIAIRPVNLSSPIVWGQIYVVVLEEYRLVKYVRRHTDRDMVILHSANPDYDDMDISRRDINALYMVEAIVNLDVVG